MSQGEIKSEARFSFMEATGVIVGHGVGLGILSVPYLASRNTWWDFIWIALLAFGINVLLHLMIAELSYNNEGGQFVTCLGNCLCPKSKKAKSIITWIALVFLAFSVLMNVSGYITGCTTALKGLLALIFKDALPTGVWLDVIVMLIYYMISGLIVFFGMKIVGISEKYTLYALIVVMLIFLVAVFIAPKVNLNTSFIATTNMLALYGMISFALSAVMSAPQVVKGLNGDKKKVIGSITLGIGINITLVMLLTFITLLGAGDIISKDGAIHDLAMKFGTYKGWYNIAISVLGYVFTLIALSGSFWANTLNLRDMISEQTKLNNKISWLITSIPCVIVALLLIFIGGSLVGLSRVASIIQILTNVAIIVAYGISRKKAKESKYVGVFGKLPFQILVIAMALVATIGSVLSVK